jgi:type VI protein secretion system component Hcp
MLAAPYRWRAPRHSAYSAGALRTENVRKTISKRVALSLSRRLAVCDAAPAMRIASSSNHADFGQRAARSLMSRRRFVGSTASAAGAVLGAWLWVPLLTQAQTTPAQSPPPGRTPTPVPKPKILPAAPAGQGDRFFLEFAPPTDADTAAFTVGPQSGDQAHPDSIELLEAALGIENPATIGSASSGVGAGKASFEALRIVKSVDATSPDLVALCGQGATFPQMSMYVRRAGSDTDDLVYQFKLVKLTRIEVDADSGGDAPQETVDFVFGALQIAYTSVGATSPMTAAWSVVQNQPVFDTGQEGR